VFAVDSGVKNKDQASLKQLYEHYDADLYRRFVAYFVRHGLSVEAEDCADTVLLKVREQLRMGRVLQYPHAYAYTVAKNVLFRAYEKRKRVVPFSDLSGQEMNLVANVADESPDPISRMEVEKLNRMKESSFDEALSKLKPADKKLLLRYLESGRDERKALAAEFGLTVNALRVKAYRIREQLKSAARKTFDRKTGKR
jgi:RNA polymerase sigma factor (sigma-70 family)